MNDDESIGLVAELWRYPVKSLGGERVDPAVVESRGLAGDRLWSVRDADGKFGSGKTTRRFRRMDGLLELAAAYDGDVPVVSFPDGRRIPGDDPVLGLALTAHLGTEVSLGRESDVSHFDEGPLHLVTTASLRTAEHAHGAELDTRRIRANIVLETPGRTGLLEDGWIGQQLAIGPELVVAIRGPMTRCVMIDLPQIGLARDGGWLRTVADLNDSCLGVVADVARPGTVREGDGARLLALSVS